IHRDILGAVRLATFSPDGRWLITAGTRGDAGKGAAERNKAATSEANTDRIDEVVRLWHWGPGGLNPKDRHELDPRGPISDLQVSPDGRWLAVQSYPGRGRLYDLRAPDPLSHPVVLHTHSKDKPQDVAAIAFAPDSRRMAVTGQRGLVVIWDLDRPRPAVVDHVVLRRTGQGARGNAPGPGRTPERSLLTVAERTEEGDVELALVRAFTPDGDLVITHGLAGNISIVGRRGEGAQARWKVLHQVSHGGPSLPAPDH
ncbi:MAG: WD40 repeat domain-containing protein, partial [Planctomycetaceae bacterium]|nr:WD40 repeat domain-containing protein [Planctomycetaceae bacterium]